MQVWTVVIIVSTFLFIITIFVIATRSIIRHFDRQDQQLLPIYQNQQCPCPHCRHHHHHQRHQQQQHLSTQSPSTNNTCNLFNVKSSSSNNNNNNIVSNNSVSSIPSTLRPPALSQFPSPIRHTISEPRPIGPHRTWRRRRENNSNRQRRRGRRRNNNNILSTTSTNEHTNNSTFEQGLTCSQVSLAALRITLPVSTSTAPCSSPKTSFLGRSRQSSSILCTICLEELVMRGDNVSDVRRLAVCGHIFHSVCIRNWLRRANKCPNCQRVAFHTESNHEHDTHQHLYNDEDNDDDDDDDNNEKVKTDMTKVSGRVMKKRRGRRRLSFSSSSSRRFGRTRSNNINNQSGLRTSIRSTNSRTNNERTDHNRRSTGVTRTRENLNGNADASSGIGACGSIGAMPCDDQVMDFLMKRMAL